jgi:imidazolonepropionase-like amidohydrolase
VADVISRTAPPTCLSPDRSRACRASHLEPRPDDGTDRRRRPRGLVQLGAGNLDLSVSPLVLPDGTVLSPRKPCWWPDAGFTHALREGWITGPDLLISLRQLSPTAGLGDTWTPDLGTRDLDEARRCRRDVLANAHSAHSATAAARAGVRSIEHGVFLDEAAVAAMREEGCWYVPTLAPIHHAGDDQTTTAHRRSLALTLQTGVPVAAGSDMAPRPHVDLLTELHLLSEAGLGDAGALKAATSEAARLLRLDHDRGRIEPGLRADLVLLDQTALDVSDLASRIRSVWHNGQIIP